MYTGDTLVNMLLILLQNFTLVDHHFGCCFMVAHYIRNENDCEHLNMLLVKGIL